MKESIRYIALLRGINVGGNKKVPMQTLREMLEHLGFTNVKTLLNSGNVAFDSTEVDRHTIIKKIEEHFVKTFGFESKIILRTIPEIQELIAANPFKEIKVTSKIRLYISFLAEKSQTKLHIPYISTDKDFTILSKMPYEVVSVLDLDKAQTTDSMAFIEKEFGKQITTRNWNTVLKLANL